MTKYTIIAVVVAFALARPFMPLHQASWQGSYEAFAHMLVGGLFGAWLANSAKWWCLWTALAFSGVEVVCAAVSFINK